MLALGSFLAVLGPSSAGRASVNEVPAPTIVVVPFDADGSLSDLGYALGLRALGILRAVGGTNLVHPRILDAVEVRYDYQLSRLSPRRRRARLGRLVAADYVLHGSLDASETHLKLSLSGKGGTTNIALRAPTFDALMSKLPVGVTSLLKRSRAVQSAAPPAPSRISPLTSSHQAMLDHAACHRALVQHPLGITFPIVVDESAIRLAMDFCESALIRDPMLESARADLALAHALVGERKEAERLLFDLKDSPSVLPMYWMARFWILSRYYDHELALESLRDSLRTYPGFMLGRGYLGEALLALGRYDEAKAVFDDYLRRCPRQSYVMGQIALVLGRANRHEEAIGWSRRALRTSPGDSGLEKRLGQRLLDAGRNEEAVAHLERVIEKRQAGASVHLSLGRARLAMGDRTGAERQIRLGLAKARGPSGWRNRGRARYQLARLWLEAGSPENAVRQIRQALLEGYVDRNALRQTPLKSLQNRVDYRDLKKLKPRRQLIPNYVSPLGRVGSSAQLEPRSSFERKTDRKVLERL